MTTMAGVWAASLTPLNESLDPDPSRMVDHVHGLVESGCDGVVVFGTTGEATSFSVGERRQLLAEIVEHGLDPSRLIVGVGCAAVTDTVELSNHAADLGCAGLLMLPPFYYKGLPDKWLGQAYGWVFERLIKPMPVLLYNIPQVSGVTISSELAASLGAEYPGIVVGIKDSSGELASLLEFISAWPSGRVFTGDGRLLLAGLEEGGAGTISGPANVNASLIRRAYDGETQVVGAFDELRQALVATIRRELGPIAVVGELNFVSMLPKTRSGKIMRRVLKAVVLDRDPGDITTIEDEGSVDQAREAWQQMKNEMEQET